MPIKPEALKEGDLIGIIAPASPPNQQNLMNSLDFLEKDLKLQIKWGSSIDHKYGYLAGKDEERAKDLNEMFADDRVKAIICACGGYGTSRMAEFIDYDMIRKKPKIFWGYSDITFLHTAIRQSSGLVTFHGPMLASDIGSEDIHPLSKKGFNQLFHNRGLEYTEALSPLTTLNDGIAEGELTGGNLCLLATSLGTPYEIDTKGKILLIEDIHEEPRNIDRYLSQLYLAGKLNDAEGLVIGDFAESEPKRTESLKLEEVLEHYVQLCGKPAVSGFMIGHCNPHVAVPLGTQVKLNASNKNLMLESGIHI